MNLESVATVLGLGSVAIGFALKDILSNLVSGVLLLVMRPFEIDPIRSRRSDFRDRCGSSIIRHERRWSGEGPRPTAVRGLRRRSELPDEHSSGRPEPFADHGHPQLETEP